MAADLKAKCSVDSTDLDKTESKMLKFAEKWQNQFIKKLAGGFAGTAVAAGIIGFITRLFEKSDKIDQLSKRFGLAADEVQLLTKAFELMGMSFEEGMSKAENGAIDLQEQLDKMRAKGGMSVISNEDIATIQQANKALKELKERMDAAAIHRAAEALRSTEQIGRSVEIMHDALAKGMFGPNAAANAQAPRAFRGVGAGASWGDPVKSEGLIKNEAMRALQAQLRALKEQRVEMRNIGTNELIQPELTQRQQVGAYSSQQGSVETKLDEATSSLRSIDSEIQKIEQQIQDLKNG